MPALHGSNATRIADILHHVFTALTPSGLDIAAPLALRWYNDSLADTAAASNAIIPVSPAGSDAFTLLIGNSKALWPRFLQACHRDGSLLSDPHPLERYVEQNVINVLASTTLKPYGPARVFWSHSLVDLQGGPGYVALQRMAACAGLAYLDEVSHLSLSKPYGPWFALRCAVVFDGVAATGGLSDMPAPLANPMTTAERLAVEAAARIAHTGALEVDIQADGDVAVGACRASSSERKLPTMIDVRADWQRWLAVRDAAAPGHPARYSEDQILYHYTGDRGLLKKLVDDVRINDDRSTA
jgi:hypothetical protein